MKFRPIVMWPLFLMIDKQFLTGRHFEDTLTGIVWSYRTIWQRNLLRLARPRRAPMALSCNISKISNLIIHPDDLNNLQTPNLYVQNYRATVTLGRGTYIAPNVGLITANHDPVNLDRHLTAQPIVIGENCWVGMNSIVLPGVVLGAGTVVGAGSVVTKSFPIGNCIIAGAPAQVIRILKLPEKP